MKITARDIMSTRFHTVTPQTPVNQAVKLFKQTSKDEGRKIFGMVVIDNEEHLVGMISMYDILLFMRPKHTHIWGMIDDIDIAGIIDMACEKTKSVLVGDIMTPEVITITPQTQSGGAGESHPHAPTDPCVNLSIHTAPASHSLETSRSQAYAERNPVPPSYLVDLHLLQAGSSPSLQPHYRTFNTNTG